MLSTHVKKVARTQFAVLVALGVGYLCQQANAQPEPGARKVFELKRKIGKKIDFDNQNLELTMTMQQAGMARNAVFSPDGKRVATCGFDGAFRVWDAETGKEVFHWTEAGLNSAVAYSRDGKRIAGGNADGKLLIWDADKGKELASQQTGQGNVYALIFSPGGQFIASANHNASASIWNAQTGANVRHLPLGEGRGRVWSAAYSPDGKTLAAAGEDRVIFLWDAATGKEIRKLQGHTGHIAAVAFSPDGTKLVSVDTEDTIRRAPAPEGLNDTIRVHDVPSGKQLLEIKNPGNFAVSYSPDGKRLASVDRAGAINLWDAATGKLLTKTQGHAGPAISVQFDSLGGRLASSGTDGAVPRLVIQEVAMTTILGVLKSAMRVMLIQSPDRQLQKVLNNQGCVVDAADTAVKASERVFRADCRVVVLDLDLAGIPGLQLVKEWRRLGCAAAVLALTSRTEAVHKAEALNAGADALLGKPYDLGELLAQIKALLRRTAPYEDAVLRVHDLEIDAAARQVKRAGQPITLTRREFELLNYLAAHRGKVVSRAKIFESVCCGNGASSSNIVDVHICTLRFKIDKGFELPLILTRYGEGYLLPAEIVITRFLSRGAAAASSQGRKTLDSQMAEVQAAERRK